MKKYKVGLISLGCDKNRVDSEIMLGKMESSYELTNEPKEADVIIVNTCGFIETAKEESINTILEMSKYKTKHNCKLLIATGCLTQRYGKELMDIMPEIDIMLGVNDYSKIDEMIESFIKDPKKVLKVNYTDEKINEGIRLVTTKKTTAYLRIAEGCNNFCTYCIIPKIRGKFRSRTKENILNEARMLAKNGTKELILIAQDLTDYGSDIDNKQTLHLLLREISKIEGIEWIRLLYCYPEEIYDELIEEIRANEKVCNYLDLPIQHISNNVLKRMGRRTTKEEIIGKINKLRDRVPGITLRTSLIVGFPGETDEDFKELKDFIRDIKLDKVGVFRYSQEEGTPAATMDGQISDDVKLRREEIIMLEQLEVSRENMAAKVGKEYKVVIEEKEKDYYIGRSVEMAPEIDGDIIVNGENLKIGSFYNVKIVEGLDYDLVGVVKDEFSK